MPTSNKEKTRQLCSIVARSSSSNSPHIGTALSITQRCLVDNQSAIRVATDLGVPEDRVKVYCENFCNEISLLDTPDSGPHAAAVMARIWNQSRTPSRSFCPGKLCLVSVGILLLAIINSNMLWPARVVNRKACFHPSQGGKVANETVGCGDFVQCPANGICNAGVLESCLPSCFVVSPDASRCQLSETTEKQFAHVMQLLHTRTVEYFCDSWTGSLVMAIDFSSIHWIRLEELMTPNSDVPNMEGNLTQLLQCGNMTHSTVMVETRGGVRSAAMIPSAIKLPHSCTVMKNVCDFIGNLFKGAWQLAIQMCQKTSTVLLCCFLLTMAVLVIWWRQRKAKKAEIRQALERALFLVKQLAVERNSGHGLQSGVIHASMLRDMIAFDFYPNDESKRNQFTIQIWPKVKECIERDCRVNKNGEVWLWAFPVSTRQAIG